MKRIISRAVDKYRRDGALATCEGGFSLAWSWATWPLRAVHNRRWVARHGPATSILEKDWDNLLLLDACRYDEFCRVAAFDSATVDKRVTLGSRTPEFLDRTFSDVRLHDTVYLTANPQPLKFISETPEPVFYDVISLLDEWDSEAQTVRPETVREAALEAARTYPNKRLLVHFLQPHTPFLGPTADRLREQTGVTIGGVDPGRKYTDADPREIETAAYEKVVTRHPEVDRETVREAYRETLGIVLAECRTLVDSLPGKTALTSDHGELLGERVFPFGRRRWAHPGGIRTSELCIVPWVEFDTAERKAVTTEPPVSSEKADQELVSKRLTALGYR